MNQLMRFRVPAIGAAACLVVFVIVYVAWISPHKSATSQLDAQKSTLQGQFDQLQAQINSLKNALNQEKPNCAALNAIQQQIPPASQVDTFLTDLQGLISASGVSASSITLGGGTSGSASSGQSAAGVVATTVNVTITGNYGQIISFLQGLDYTGPSQGNPAYMPRLFTISHLTISGGPVAVGGSPVAAGTPGYTVVMSGTTYNTSSTTHDACTPTS